MEMVRFSNPRLPSVRVVRGVPSGGAPAGGAPAGVNSHATPALPPPQFHATQTNTEIVSFGDGTARTVTVVRGSGATPATPQAPRYAHAGIETVRFGDRRPTLVEIVRGIVTHDARRDWTGASPLDVFGVAHAGELDRIAFAVDGAESGHGSNLAMWRPGLDGPQGPMQVSAAAAFDVGGGDRFDLRQNRLIGRAYLALLYHRYGSWPDAIAAYNWGPGNLDSWISAGRPLDRLPLETARYLNKVLRDAFMLGPS